ncbi:MAG: hypothetical protein AB1634_16225 [Thermodesulfobacteriota bacterium]
MTPTLRFLLLALAVAAASLISPPAWSLLGQPPGLDLEADLGLDPAGMQVVRPEPLRAQGMRRVRPGDRIRIIPTQDGGFLLENERTRDRIPARPAGRDRDRGRPARPERRS